MQPLRKETAEKILQSIQYGSLPRDEAEKKLDRMLDEALDVPMDSPVCKEKVDLCNSLLRQLYASKENDTDDNFKTAAETSKETVETRYSALKRKKRRIIKSISTCVAAIMLAVGLSLASLITPMTWFSVNSTEDQQQAEVFGHQIGIQTVTTALAAHNGSGSLKADSIEEINRYTGLDLCFPRNISFFEPKTYYVSFIPEILLASCVYQEKASDDLHKLTITMILFTDPDEAYVQFEQEKTGEWININGVSVYRSLNLQKLNYLWTNGPVIFRVSMDKETRNGDSLINEIITWRDDS